MCLACILQGFGRLLSGLCTGDGRVDVEEKMGAMWCVGILVGQKVVVVVQMVCLWVIQGGRHTVLYVNLALTTVRAYMSGIFAAAACSRFHPLTK